jgi:hypothetical protein
MMKHMNKRGIEVFIWAMLLSGCTPSVTVIPAGQENQYEVTVHADELTFTDTEGLIHTWHHKSRETCGGTYRVIGHGIIEHGESSDDSLITGIVECQ